MSLVELVVAVALTVMVAALAGALVVGMRRRVGALAETASLRRTLQTAAWVLDAELRGAPTQIAAESVAYRATRFVAASCAITAAEVKMRMEPGWYAADRMPVAGRDSLAVFVDPPPGDTTAAGWIHAPILTVAPARCGAHEAVALGTRLDSALVARAVPLGAPVHTFEPMQLRLYGAPTPALGARAIATAEAVQPFAGPFAAGGLALRFLDSAGAPTADPAAVDRIEATLRALTPRPVWLGDRGTPTRIADSLTLRIPVARSAP